MDRRERDPGRSFGDDLHAGSPEGRRPPGEAPPRRGAARLSRLLGAAAVVAAAGCATLNLADVLSAPRFSEARDRDPVLRLLGPSVERPSGGAAVRLWARVENPNDVGITLASLTGDLFLEDARAAAVDFPLGVPLLARGDTVIPLELSLDFEDLPGLADAATRALTGQPLRYRLEGTVSVDAGALGRPSFGPSTLVRGELEVLRR